MSTSSDLPVRAGSALAIIPPVLAAVWAGGWAFYALLLLGGGLLALEWGKLGFEDSPWPLFTLLHLAAYAAPLTLLQLDPDAVLLALVLLAAGVIAALELAFSLRRPLWPAAAMAILAGAPLILLVLRQDYGMGAVYWLLACVWAADSGAYFAGRLLGGPKLAPAISPAKTWAGVAGSFLAAGAAGLAAALLMGLDPVRLFLLSLWVCFAVQLGDLLESWVKRLRGVKDSGALIPGHGGALDRLDGLAMACCALLPAMIWAGLPWR